MYCNVCNKYRKSKKHIKYKNIKYLKKTLSLPFAYSVIMIMKKYLKKKNQLQY